MNRCTTLRMLYLLHSEGTTVKTYLDEHGNTWESLLASIKYKASHDNW